MASRARTLSLLTPLLAVAVLPAQQTALRQRLDAAVAGLADPSNRAEACAALVRLGSVAVPPVTAVVRASRQAAVAGYREDECSAALYVLGQLRERSLPALAEVLAVYRERALADALRCQALWAMGEIVGASGDVRLFDDALELMRRLPVNDPSQLLPRRVQARMRLGPQPTHEELLLALADGPGPTAAVCDVLMPRSGVLAPELASVLQGSLERGLSERELPWQPGDWFEAVAGEIAALLAARGPPRQDALVPRGLLRHWDPDLRVVALVRWKEQAPPTRGPCLEVVARLWDPQPPVRQAALATLTAWGAAGLPALAALRDLQRRALDPEFGADCGRAAEAIAAAAIAAAAGEPARQVLLALERAVAAEPGAHRQAATPMVADAEATERYADVAWGCHGAPPAVALAVLTLGVDAGCGGRAAVLGMLRCLASLTTVEHAAALTALARLGRRCLDAVPDVAAQVTEALYASGQPFPTGLVLECEAWLTVGPDATDVAVVTAMQDGGPRVKLRALTELVDRGRHGDEVVRRWLAEHLSAVHFGECRVATVTLAGKAAGPWYLGPSLDADLAMAVGLLAASNGIVGWDAPARRSALAREFAVSEDEVAGWVAGQVGGPGLATMMRQLEERARGKLGSTAIRSGSRSDTR